MPKNRFVRMLVSLLIIYIAWSIVVDIVHLRVRVDNEALIPCLMYLPPLGFLILGLVAVKVIESAIVIRIIRKLLRRKRKQQ